MGKISINNDLLDLYVKKSDYIELETELQRAKAENEKLKTDIGIYKGIIDSDKEENERLKARLRPLEDSYFKGLSSIEIAELAKKSIRVTAENRKLEYALQEIRDIAGFHTSKDDSEDVQSDMQDIIDKINSVIGAEE